MLRFIRWLIGFVSFSFDGGFSEGFINECYLKGYNISDVCYNGNTLCASCPAELYPYLRPVAKAHGGKIRIVKKRGIVFKLLPLRNRWGLFAGALMAVIIICSLSGFVWNVEVTGNEKISSSEALRLLNENGLKKGVPKSSVDKGRLESLVMAAFPDCAWAHINEEGTTMRLEIGEAVRKPKTVNKRKYTNLVAKKDGVLIKTFVYSGWQKRKRGDAVVKGDILISGFKRGKKNKNLFAHARGKYIAEVREPVNIKISRQQKEKVYESESKYKYLYFFSLKIPLFLSRMDEGDISESCDFAELNGEKLPLGIITKTVKTFSVKTVELTDRELQALAGKQLSDLTKNELKNCKIISKKLNTSLGSEDIAIKGYILCIENIGKEVKIMK